MRDEEAVRGMIRELWLRNRPVALERLAVVRAAVDELAGGRELAADTRQVARSEAHKLHGVLGSYGFSEGSAVLGEAEALLQDGADPDLAADLGARLAACAVTLEAKV
jgi:HPt (histidine-containing phosphotransfer) domain-containing protein